MRLYRDLSDDERAEWFDQPFLVVREGRLLLDVTAYRDGLVTGCARVERSPWPLWGVALVLLPLLFGALPLWVAWVAMRALGAGSRPVAKDERQEQQGEG